MKTEAPDHVPAIRQGMGLTTGPGLEELAIGASPSPSPVKFSRTPEPLT